MCYSYRAHSNNEHTNKQMHLIKYNSLQVLISCVSVPACHLQGLSQIKGTQVQQASLRIVSPSLELLKIKIIKTHNVFNYHLLLISYQFNFFYQIYVF